MTHTSWNGEPKIVPKASLPLTATGAVDLVITDLAVFEFMKDQLTLIELMPGATLEQVRSKTSAAFVEAP
jgi:3-oxoacid CoA-transferase